MRRALAGAGRRTEGDLAALWVIEGVDNDNGQLAQAANMPDVRAWKLHA